MSGQGRHRHARSTSARRHLRVVPSTPAGVVSSNGPYRARTRPLWQRLLGWSMIAAGFGFIVVNDAADLGIELPAGGHIEGYLFLGLLVVAIGAWWTGLFDRL